MATVHKCPYPAAANSFTPGETGLADKDGKPEKKEGAYTGESKNKLPSRRYWTGGVTYSYVGGKLRVVVYDTDTKVVADVVIDPPKKTEDFPDPEEVAAKAKK